MKKIFFDLDGTIADLYNEKNWLEKLQSEKRGLFENLKTMHSEKSINEILNKLVENGFQIGVITWTPKNVSERYIKRVELEKNEWVKKFPQISEIHCLNYGTPKQKANFKKAKMMILVDDNKEVLEMWDTSKQRKSILADKNLIEKLFALVD